MDTECPYCEKWLEINHNDGFGYEVGGVKQQMEYEYCLNSFVFETSISFNYSAEKADCLNTGKHDYKIMTTYPREFSQMEFKMCGERSELTDAERAEFNIGTKENYFKKI